MKHSHSPSCFSLALAGRLRATAGLLLAATVLLSPRPAAAQNYFYGFGPNPWSDRSPLKMGSVDLTNGNLELAIPIASMPERGRIPFRAALVYESHLWQQVTSSGSTSWQPTNVAGSIGGWKMVETGQPGSVSDTWTVHLCGSGPPYTMYYTYSNFVWTAPNGRQVPFNLTTTDAISCGVSSPTANGMAADGSGYQMYITGYTTATVYAVDGTELYPRVEDTNGNYYSLDANGNAIDTLGRTPVTATHSGTPPTYTYAVLNSTNNGSSGAYDVTVATESIAVNTDFGQPLVSEYSGNITVVQSITLPDGSTYSFGYDEGSSGTHYGTLTSMTLPTGGTVSFTHDKFEDAFGNYYLYLESCSWGGGTWTYTPQVITTCGTSCSQKVTITKPSGSGGTDDEVHTFTFYGIGGGYFWGAAPWVTEQDYYSGASTLVKKVQTGFTAAPDIYQQTITTTLPGPSGNLVKQTGITYTSNGAGTPSVVTEYGYGSGAHGASQRVTSYGYYSDASGLILNAPQTISVTGMGSSYSETITYDSYGSGLTSVTGKTNHDDTNYGVSNTDRGNPTSIEIGSQTVATLTYDTTGQVLTSTDANGNKTTLSYGDRFYHDNGANPPATYTPSAGTNAYLTEITLPTPSSGVTQIWTLGYYFGSGKPALMYDPNAHPSYFHTDGPSGQDAWDRIVETLPPLGWRFTDYASTTEADSYVGIQSTSPTSCSSCSHYQTILDSFGRVSSKSLVSDPDGESTSTVSYYGNSEAETVTPLLRSGNEPVADTFTYDGLGRMLTDTNAQSTAKNWYYGANVSSGGGLTSQACSASTYGYGFPVVGSDESGYKRETWTDGIGNVIEVDEPSPSGGSFSSGYSTCYKSDAFGKLTEAVQGSQTRTYTYDSLERLTSAATPESGTVSYSYTHSGALCSGNINQVCVMTDARSISTVYFYDALGRLTEKEYTDSTPAAYFYYDESSVWGVSPTNPVGRLTLATKNSGGTVYSYDANGRIIETWQVAYADGNPIDEHELYSWNLDGSLASITYPSGRVVNYAVGNAGRPTSATDGSGYQYAAPQGGSWPEYAAFGPLETMTNGAVSGSFAGINTYSTWANGIPRLVLYGNTAVVGSTYIMNSAYGPQNDLNFTTSWDDTDSGRTQSYVYDYLQRLTSATTTATSGAECWGESYTIDRYSNLTGITNTQCSGESLSLTVSSSTNRVSGNTYDSAGNTLTDSSGLTLSYDAENRMIEASGMGGGPWYYVYDANQMRIEKCDAATSSSCTGTTTGTMYWRDIFGNVLSESSMNGTMQNDYIYFGGKRIAYVTGGSTYYYFADQLGSVRRITDQNGNICFSADYAPYGKAMYTPTNSCPTQPYEFAGYARDPELASDGLDFANARYYNYRQGRFMSADPLGGSPLNPQSLNRYAYVVNNSINHTDPSGMLCKAGRSCWGDGWNDAGGGGGGAELGTGDDPGQYGGGYSDNFNCVFGCDSTLQQLELDTLYGAGPDGAILASFGPGGTLMYTYWVSAFTGAYDYQTFDGNYIGGNWTGWSADQGSWESTGSLATGDGSMGPYAGALGMVYNNTSGLVSGKAELYFYSASVATTLGYAFFFPESQLAETLSDTSLDVTVTYDASVPGGVTGTGQFVDGALGTDAVNGTGGLLGRGAQIAWRVLTGIFF